MCMENLKFKNFILFHPPTMKLIMLVFFLICPLININFALHKNKTIKDNFKDNINNNIRDIIKDIIETTSIQWGMTSS